MEIVILSLLCILLVGGAFAIYHHYSKALAEETKRAATLQSEVAAHTQRLTELQAAVATEQTARKVAETRLEEANTFHAKELQRIEDTQKQASDAFRVMASEIMKENTEAMMQQNQSQVGTLLSPLKEDIERFRKQVADCYTAESRERFSLQNHIRELMEANATIGREAKELAMALRGNSKTQGDWGEFLLESILEQSGLREGFEFFPQLTSEDGVTTLRDAAGRGLRPDVVVRYPGNLSVVIDSKVSLTSYVNYINADTEADRDIHLKAHLASISKHIAELAGKNYQDYIGVNKLDFVMMFVPNEGAYAAAMKADPTIWQKAFDKRVLMVSPVQLVASLRIVRQVWTQEAQTRNTIKIAKEAGELYNKFAGYLEDMQRIEASLTSARKAYDAAMNKLCEGRGNVVRRIENLKDLGVKAEKNLQAVLKDKFPDYSE